MRAYTTLPMRSAARPSRRLPVIAAPLVPDLMPWPSETAPLAAYVAAPGFEPQLAEELRLAGQPAPLWHGRLAMSEAPPIRTAWALECWTAPMLLPAPSVGAAADALRAIQRNWALLPGAYMGRARLISARLPVVKAKPLVFPEPAPTSHLGGWCLLSPEMILASPSKTSPFLNGEPCFVEDREGPPSRAYLKLWEGLTRWGRHPGQGEVCIDLGASPGGWTWALAQLGACVTSVDKAPLAPTVAAMPGVTWLQDSAFAVEPCPVDWLFSDVICYPQRLLTLVRRWIAADAARHIMVTVKFQSGTDHDAAAAFAAIPGGMLFHSAQNKHELTFCWTRPTDSE